MRRIAVLTVLLLSGVAHPGAALAVDEVAPTTSTAAPVQPAAAQGEARMFSPEWREQKIRDREQNLQALDEEQRRFDRWESSARQAVGGICADCLGGNRSSSSITIPADAIPNVPSASESIAGFDDMSAHYVVAPAPEPPNVVPAPARAASAAVPLDIRPPGAR